MNKRSLSIWMFALTSLWIICNLDFCLSFQSEDMVESTGTDAANGIYFEFMGNTGPYSLNYERLVSKYLAVRVGLAYLPPPVDWYKKWIDANSGADDWYHYGFATVGLSSLVSVHGDLKAELGLGLTAGVRDRDLPAVLLFFLDKDAEKKDWLNGIIGLRYHSGSGGIILRVSIIPIIMESLPLWGGVSLGYAF